MKGLAHVDIGSELTRDEYEADTGHTFSVGTAFPGTPTEMDMFYRTDEHKLYLYDGTDWVWLGGGGGDFVELDGGTSHGQVANNNWEDWDLSGVLPAGTKAILLAARHAGSSPGTGTVGARKDGSALGRNDWQLSAGSYDSLSIIAEVPVSRIIETYGQKATTVTTTTFRLMGYWL